MHKKYPIAISLTKHVKIVDWIISLCIRLMRLCKLYGYSLRVGAFGLEFSDS